MVGRFVQRVVGPRGVAVLLLALPLLLGGCGGPKRLGLAVALDVSGSTTDARAGQSIWDLAVAGLLHRTRPYAPRLAVWTYAARPELRFDGQAEAAGQVHELALAALAHTPPTRGTYPDRLLSAVAAAWATGGEERLVLVLLTDGEATDPMALKVAAERLADDERLVAVWLAGVRPEWRHRPADGAYAALGERLIVSTADEVDLTAGLGELCARLEGGMW